MREILAEAIRCRFGLALLGWACVMANATPAGAQPADVRAFVEEIKGRTYFLEIDVVRVYPSQGSRAVDATNVYPGGQVSYRGRLRNLFSSQTRASTTEEFLGAAYELKSGLHPHVWRRGSRVTIHDASARKKEVRIDITDIRGSKSRIRFKYDDGRYTLDDVLEAFATCLTESDRDLRGAEITAGLYTGMSADKVVSMRGTPTSRLDLGGITVLGYEDVKLIFEHDQLVEAQ